MVFCRARPRQSGPNRWMSYGAVYESARHPGTRIQVVIDEAEGHVDAAWKPYEEQGALGVLADNNLRIHERTSSVSISWLSSTRVIVIESAALRHIDKKFLRHFLTRYPSDLRAR